LLPDPAHQVFGIAPVHDRERIAEPDEACVFAQQPRADGALGKSLGPPWRQDEKLASMVAWIALAEAGLLH
jgi:hypothetical protein